MVCALVMILAIARDAPGALGRSPAEFVSADGHIHMSYPHGWKLDINNSHRAKGLDDSFYKSVMFEHNDSSDKESFLTVRLKAADRFDQRFMDSVLKSKRRSWTDPKKPHSLPPEFPFEVKVSFAKVHGQRAYMVTQMSETAVSLDIRYACATAYVVDKRGKCMVLDLDLEEPGVKLDASTKHAAELMKVYYPQFLAMEQSISFHY